MSGNYVALKCDCGGRLVPAYSPGAVYIHVPEGEADGLHAEFERHKRENQKGTVRTPAVIGARFSITLSRHPLSHLLRCEKCGLLYGEREK